MELKKITFKMKEQKPVTLYPPSNYNYMSRLIDLDRCHRLQLRTWELSSNQRRMKYISVTKYLLHMNSYKCYLIRGKFHCFLFCLRRKKIQHSRVIY